MASTTFSGPVTSTAGFVGAVTGDTTGRDIGTIAARSGAGAVPVTAATVRLTTTGANALTLANGTEGQLLTIIAVVVAGTATLTPATRLGFSTIAFTAVGNAAVLQYFTTQGWMIVSNYGATVA